MLKMRIEKLRTPAFIFNGMKRAFVQLHIAVFLAGFTAILGKLITLNEELLVWYRMLITGITMAIWLYLKKELKYSIS